MDFDKFIPQGYKAVSGISGVEISGPRYWFGEFSVTRAYELSLSDAKKFACSQGSATVVGFRINDNRETTLPYVDVSAMMIPEPQVRLNALNKHNKMVEAERIAAEDEKNQHLK